MSDPKTKMKPKPAEDSNHTDERGGGEDDVLTEQGFSVI